MHNLFRHTETLVCTERTAAVEILYFTCNRLPYTQITLPALLESSSNDFLVTIVDNGSTDGTTDYLRSLDHTKIKTIIMHRQNRGLVSPTRRFWRTSRAVYVGKIDNDILVSLGWIEELRNALECIPLPGVIGYCHFRPEDFNAAKVRAKTETINGITFRRQPWIGGNYLAKRTMFMTHKGYHQSRRGFRKRILCGFNSYQQRLAKKGFLHGYLCDDSGALRLWEHLDDPRSTYFLAESDHLRQRNLTPEQIIAWYQRDARALLEEC